MSGPPLLPRLPEELLQDVLSRLDVPHLKSLNRASKWCYHAATPGIWKKVELVDCKSGPDEHDDTEIIQKLLLFVQKPWIAASVQTLTHRCHLPPPSIFNELPDMTFSGQTLSADPRTIKLVQLAAANLKSVHTLRIILGHPNLTDALLRCFFDVTRRQPGAGYRRVRRLWLENCRISAGLNLSIDEHPYGLPLECTFDGLQTVRLRRVPMRPGTSFFSTPGYSYNYCRGGTARSMENGLGGEYTTSVNTLIEESEVGGGPIALIADEQQAEQAMRPHSSPAPTVFAAAYLYDEAIYQKLAATMHLPPEVALLGSTSMHEYSVRAYRGYWLDPDDLTKAPATSQWKRMQREKVPSAFAATAMLKNASSTLTSLNLDWVMNVPPSLAWSKDPRHFSRWIGIFLDLFSCRFPHLRAFQLRNCVAMETLLPGGLCLFDPSTPSFRGEEGPLELPEKIRAQSSALELAGLAFMESHPKIQCLCWPMDHFFAPVPTTDPAIRDRAQAVIDTLARTLVDLRVESLYSTEGEPMTAEDRLFDLDARNSRRRFITDFATKMLTLESIKIEGGMPRDERREIVRALHQSPLRRIIMIGVCSPLGNTWGENGVDIRQIARLNAAEYFNLQAEDEVAVHELGGRNLLPPGSDFQYIPQYRWLGSHPMLHVLASYHADTVRELKFCGYKGSPILLSPTPITRPLLSALRHFHRLESLIMSMWLTTTFEGAAQDAEIVRYWHDSRGPGSTALVTVTDDEPEGWEKELRTKYAPDALAWRITNFIAPYISEKAKRREGGVHVRASFCMGKHGGIFDVDLHVGKGAMNSDICLDYKGPREELEPEKRWSKLENRRWF